MKKTKKKAVQDPLPTKREIVDALKPIVTKIHKMGGSSMKAMIRADQHKVFFVVALADKAEELNILFEKWEKEVEKTERQGDGEEEG